MAGRHLRRARGAMLRRALLVLGVLVLGVALGAGGVLVDEGRLQVGTDDDEEDPADQDGIARLVPSPGPITLAFLGDLRPDAVAGGPASAPDGLQGALAEVAADAELVVANLELTVVDGMVPVEGEDGIDPASLLDEVAAAGVDVASVANDHGLGRGPEVVYETLTLEDARPELVVGIGGDEDHAYAPAVRRVGGTTVAVLAATQVLDPARIADSTAGPDQPGLASAKRIDRLVAEVTAAQDEADLVVVYLHWGAEGETCPTPGQQELATALVDAGADVVVGSGARAVLGAGRTGDALVSYGLGAFVGGDDGQEAGILLVEVDDGRVRSHDVLPARLVDGVAAPRAGDEAELVRAAWEERRVCAGLDP